MLKAILILGVSFFITSKPYSQILDDELINIVVTPSGFEQKIKNTNSFFRVITKKDIEKSSATNLVDANFFISVFEPDILLLDVNIPDGSGIEFCRLLRQMDL